MNPNDKGIRGENAVNEVASNTFLKYWCFPNPKDEKGTKKEICDLLILFQKTIIIISIKNYKFDGKYERYFRNTLKKAIAQIQGAERKLFHSNLKIVFNHPIKGEFKFNSSNYDTIQRVIVNLNNEPLFYPGGTITNKNNFIHIFNYHAFLKLVNELDTIPDLICYLKEREVTFSQKDFMLLNGNEQDWSIETNNEFLNYSNNLSPFETSYCMISGNELDLLADYLFNERKFSKELYSKDYNGVFFQFDGKYKEYLSRKQVILKKEEDKMSYMIDNIVEKDILYYDHDQRIEMATELLALNRFERRIAGNHFHSFIEKYRNNDGYFMAKRFGVFGDLAIGYFMHGNKISAEQVMNLMNILVLGYSYWEGYKSKKVLVFGINTGLNQTKFAFNNDVVKLPENEEIDLIHDLKVLNWFQNLEQIDSYWKEYPDE